MAWYKVGTIKVDNGSAVVTGAGTLWADNKQGIGPGQMILIPGSGTLQVYEILRVNSNTSITLASNFSGNSVIASSYAILSFYVDSYPDFNRRLASQLGYFQNLLEDIQVIMTGTGTVSITAPDGRVVSISSFAKLTSDMATKATLVNGAIPINQGGTGSNTGGFGSAEGTYAQGNDSRLNTIDGKTGGAVRGEISLPMQDGTFSYPIILTAITAAEGAKIRGSLATFTDGTQRVVVNNQGVGGRKVTIFSTGGIICQGGLNAVDPSLNSYFINYELGPVGLWIDSTRIGSISISPTSDKLLKRDIEYRTDTSAAALSRVDQWKVATFRYRSRGMIEESETKLGFIANDLVDISPDCVKGEGLSEGYDPLNPEGAYSLDEVAMIAELTQAVQALIEQNKKQQAEIDKLKSK